MTARRAAFAALALASSLAPARADDPAAAPMFPFVLPWDDATPGASNVADLLERPAGRRGPVVARGGHLYTGDRRLRLVGVNLCFGANFPTHADADKIAARMARFGINCVRFHHMDMQPAPGGILAHDRAALDPGQLDRLDYLVARLKEHGVYADLNLHVSRTYPGRPSWEGMPEFLKGVDNFDGPMIAAQQAYARELLTHRNPYTKARYADEPAVALVEINNENALLHEWWNGQLDGLIDPYRADLTTRWNDWLKRQYRDGAALKTAWAAGEQPLGPELLGGDEGRVDELRRWNLESREGAEADARVLRVDSPPVLRVHVGKAGREGWHVQVHRGGLALQAGRAYTLSFRARSTTPRRVTVNAMQAHDPWKVLWSAEVPVASDWTTFHLVFRPGAGDDRARIGLSDLASPTGTVDFAAVSLRPGGVVGLEPGESSGSVKFFRKADFATRTPEAQRDWVRFLADVEDHYWTGMYRFLKDDLKVAAPVLGTQMGWSPPTMQAKLDVIDSHAYWQHPHFPRRPWDSADWTVGNLPMFGRPDGGTLPALALSRVAGKPFLCTEYNHSAPNTYGAETLPLVFAFAALQDWDGVFVFAYSHRRDDWDAGKISGFFDIDQHPTKMATLPAAAALFLRGDLAPAAPPRLARPTPDALVEALRRHGPALRADLFGLDRTAAPAGPVALVLPGLAPAGEPPAGIVDDAPRWNWSPGGVTVDTPRSKVVVTSRVGAAHDLSGVTITPAATRQGFAVITVTALDGPDCRSSGRLLVTAAGEAANTDMRWTNSDRTSVGTHWGHRPALVEGITATVALPVPAGRVRAWGLDERGRRRDALPVAGDSGRSTLALGPGSRTLWYEVEIRP